MGLLVLVIGAIVTYFGWAGSSVLLLVLGVIMDVVGLVWTLVQLGAGSLGDCDCGDSDCGDSGGGDGGGCGGGGCGGGGD